MEISTTIKIGHNTFEIKVAPREGEVTTESCATKIHKGIEEILKLGLDKDMSAEGGNGKNNK